MAGRTARGARYLGVDLAWGQRNRTGLAALGPNGRLLDSCSVRSDDDIAVFVGRHRGDYQVAAIDAPLIVPNDVGRRPCEATVGLHFGRYRAGAYPANRGNPHFVPEPRAARLAQRFGWQPDPAVRPGPGRDSCIEVYPHPAMVSLFGLDTVIPYKIKPGRDLPALQAAYQRLLDLILATCGDLLGLADSPRWTELRSIAAGAVRKSELDAIEDEIDAIFCAYLAWLWDSEPSPLVVFGNVTTGYIVTPAPPVVRRRSTSRGLPG